MLNKLLKNCEVTHAVKPIDRIKVTVYRGDEPADEFFVKTRAKSKLAKLLVLAVGRILTFRRSTK